MITPPPPERQCTATSKGTGERCGQWSAGPGITVCHYHGGGAPQVKAAAMERILQAVAPAIAELFDIAMDRNEDAADRIRACRDLLDRAGLAAKHQVQLTGDDGGPIGFTVTAADTLASRIAGLASRIRSREDDTKSE